MKSLIVIPARGGSKGIPGKNIKLLDGKPLIQYTLEAARAVFDDKVICVSTDDLQIKEKVESFGIKVPFLRPAELATDESSSYEVLQNALEFYEAIGYRPDTLILLQPTSPFRSHKHLKEAISLYNEECDMVVSVKETNSNPYSVLFEDNEEGFLIKSKEGTFSKRQDCPLVWELNGAIYIINVASFKERGTFEFKKIKKYIMNELHSIDIDTTMDWLFAEFIIEKGLIGDINPVL